MRLLPFVVAALFAAAPAAAHEFWISPDSYTIEPGDQLVAHLRVGEDFKGGSSPFLPSRFARFELVYDNKRYPVGGRVGDRPALSNTPPGEGLITVVHQTSNNLLTYKGMTKFQNFAKHKDFEWALEAHADRGLPEDRFREVYSRYGKSLMAVGHGKGADRNVGLLTEIVALSNPYTDDMSSGLPVRVLYQNKPRADVQVEVFERAPGGKVSISLHRTNGKGEVSVPVKPGHEYLVDAVILRAVEPAKEDDPVWESLWASLTFKVPG